MLNAYSPSATDDETLNNDPLEKKEITTTFSITTYRGTLQPKLQPFDDLKKLQKPGKKLIMNTIK